MIQASHKYTYLFLKRWCGVAQKKHTHLHVYENKAELHLSRQPDNNSWQLLGEERFGEFTEL